MTLTDLINNSELWEAFGKDIAKMLKESLLEKCGEEVDTIHEEVEKEEIELTAFKMGASFEYAIANKNQWLNLPWKEVKDLDINDAFEHWLTFTNQNLIP